MQKKMIQRTTEGILNPLLPVFLSTGFYFRYESLHIHVSVMTTATSRKTFLQAIMISCCQGDDLFCRLSTNGNFPFLENRGTHFFPKMSTAPLFISIPTPHPFKSSFCAGVQCSRDLIHAFNDRINRRENRGL